ncbi:hypothetical protein C359_02982 [Cryptococcus neoformans Bt120]|nr:hypothetical protein C359_02982 [Cryptococcus neoformans var. grubii Bt120]
MCAQRKRMGLPPTTLQSVDALVCEGSIIMESSKTGWDKELPQKKLVREDVMRDEEESQESQGDESARAIAHQDFNKLRVSSQSEPSWLCGVFSL